MKKSKQLSTSLSYLPFYIVFLIPSFLFFSLIWYFFVDGILYYCGDKMPFVDLLPPFVHGRQYGDYFIASPFAVYALWIVVLLLLFFLPILPLKGIIKEVQRGKAASLTHNRGL